MNQLNIGDVCVIKQVHIADKYVSYEEILTGKRVEVMEAHSLGEESVFFAATVKLLEPVSGYKNAGSILTFDCGVKLEKTE